MIRCSDWESKLYQYLDDCRGKQFEYGKFDCVIFVNDWLKICVGFDFLDGKEYNSREAIGTFGYRSLNDAVNKCLNSESIPAAFAQRGDIVIYDECLGICCGVFSHFINNDGGLVVLETLKADKAWHI